PDRVLVDAAELPLGDVAVIAAQLLFGTQLHAVVGELALAALAVLAGTVFAAVYGTLRAAPDVLPHAAVELVFRFIALGHRVLIRRLAPVGKIRGSRPPLPKPSFRPTGGVLKAQDAAAGRETSCGPVLRARNVPGF